MMIRRLIFFAVAILIAVPIALLAGESSGQEAATSEGPKVQIKKIPAPYTPASSGKAMYVAYCASCHGKDGKGDGPAASALKSVPSDLTRLAAKNKGKFPENRVSETIKGDFDTPSHGSKDMPVWGPIFASMGTTSDGVMQLRIRNLTKYIASLQQ
jgi:mono/diheme cytochrome c family protein